MTPGYLVERFLQLALMLLVGAICIKVSVQLIESVWVALVIVAGAILTGALIVAIIRNRSGGW